MSAAPIPVDVLISGATLITMDDARMRLVYAVVSPRVKQHSASIQIFADGKGHSRMVWIADVLPNEIAPYIDSQMALGAAAMQKQFRRDAPISGLKAQKNRSWCTP